jgi:hypothetical protein
MTNMNNTEFTAETLKTIAQDNREYMRVYGALSRQRRQIVWTANNYRGGLSESEFRTCQQLTEKLQILQIAREEHCRRMDRACGLI